MSGEGAPVVCLPGGPLLDSASLGDLGGLSGRLRLIRPDYRGTGRSETPGRAIDGDWDAITPLTYGRWDAAARTHHARENRHRNEEGAAAFGAKGAFDPAATRAALTAFAAPVLLLAGELDVAAPPHAVAEYATACGVGHHDCGGSSPTSPSTGSRRRSAWPTCRA